MTEKKSISDSVTMHDDPIDGEPVDGLDALETLLDDEAAQESKAANEQAREDAPEGFSDAQTLAMIGLGYNALCSAIGFRELEPDEVEAGKTSIMMIKPHVTPQLDWSEKKLAFFGFATINLGIFGPRVWEWLQERAAERKAAALKSVRHDRAPTPVAANDNDLDAAAASSLS